MKKKILGLMGVFLVGAMLMTGCGSNDAGKKTEEGQKASKGAFQADIGFNGSSTLAPVITKIGTEFMDENKTWDKVNPDFPSEEIAIQVTSGGSGQGVKAVIDQTSDFGLIARSVKDEEKNQIENYKEYQVGIDALLLAVNKNNPILQVKDDLTKDEIVKIFSGEYKTWKDVNASLPEKEIVVITRDIGGGAHEVFQSKIMGDAEVRQDAIQAPSMGALVTKIIENDYAIGYASYGVANQNVGKLVPLKVDGVGATEENIYNGSYVIQRPLLLIHSGEPSLAQQAFLNYVLGEKGITIVEEMGFIPMKK